MAKIIILLILFNIATAYFKKRAKAKRDAEARNGGNAGANTGTVSTSTTEVKVTKREAPAWASRQDEDEVVQDWDEHNLHDEDAEEGENPYRETPVRSKPTALKNEPTLDSGRGSKDLSGLGGDRGNNRSPETKAKATEIGKDILSQLAKELGLELPERPQPKPVPRPVVIPAPAETVRTAYAPRKNRVLSEDDDHARTVADSVPGTDLTSAPGIAAVESANAAAYATREGRTSMLTGIRADLFEPESLRQAFILKTILDKPLSLQPHSPGLSGAK